MFFWYTHLQIQTLYSAEFICSCILTLLFQCMSIFYTSQSLVQVLTPEMSYPKSDLSFLFYSYSYKAKLSNNVIFATIG